MAAVRRRLFIIGSVLSLSLCVATIVEQARGRFLIGQALGVQDGGIHSIDVDLDWSPSSKWHVLWMSMPLFPLTVISILPPIFALRSVEELMKSRRARRGLCEACGYDLRANLSGVCPECGRAVYQPPLNGRSSA